jgi:hypothetical protein
MIAYLLFLALINLHSSDVPTAHGAIEATIRGTSQPIEAVLLRRSGEAWTELDRRRLAPSVRAVRFDALPAGIYQVLIIGTSSTEQFGTKVVIGDGDTRRAEITIDPATVTGRVTLNGKTAGPGAITLRHKELQWRALIPIAPDGTFHALLWQRGDYSFSARTASLTTSYTSSIVLEGVSPISFPIEVPDGRITGIVHDAKSGAPVGGASVALQTDSAGRSQHVNTITNRNGRFDFNGLPFGRQSLTVVSGRYLEPSPIAFDLDAAKPSRDLDIPLDTGMTIAIMVRDAGDHPVANAAVFAVLAARRRSRATTDENGSAILAVPVTGTSSLFVIPDAGGFTTMQLAPQQDGRLIVHLPKASSSLRIRARTTAGKPMPNFSLLMRYNNELMPLEIADELSVAQGLQFGTNESEAYLRNIPAGKYEFWPYRTKEEADSIIAAGNDITPPIQVDVRNGENSIIVKFAAR